MTYDAKEVARLIAELREDDARMTPGPWIPGEHEFHIGGDVGHADGPIHIASMEEECLIADRDAIIRLRNNARALADQLEAQQKEIARLQVDLRCEQIRSEDRGISFAEVERLKRDVIGNVERLTKVQDMLVAERDRLRAEIAQLRQGLHPDGSGRYDALLVERRKRQEDLELADRTAAEQVKYIDGLIAEVARLRPIVEASVALRESESTEAGTAEMSIAQLEPLAEAARKRTHDSLIRWRTAVDACRDTKEKP